MVATRLKVVPSRQRKLDVGVVEVDPIRYPSGYGPRRNTGKIKHGRYLKHGEIKRFVQMCLEVFFTETLPASDRHEPLDLYDITHAISPEVVRWVGKISNNDQFRLIPYQVAQALRTMEIRGIKFRIDGQVVMLPSHSNDNIISKVKLQRR